MKTNKEFIDGIYQKADEIENENKVKRQINIRNITNIAAILIIAIALGLNIKANKKPNESITLELQSNENKISLKTVDNFQNFCTIVKNIETKKTNSNLSYSEGLMVESATNSVAQDTTASKTNTQVENVDEADIVKVQENYTSKVHVTVEFK